MLALVRNSTLSTNESGYAIAAAVAHPSRKVVGVQGDSAFGFSAMEVSKKLERRNKPGRGSLPLQPPYNFYCLEQQRNLQRSSLS